jgi:predicted metal-dependent hydrolase
MLELRFDLTMKDSGRESGCFYFLSQNEAFFRCYNHPMADVTITKDYPLDQATLEQTCRAPLSEIARRGLQLFNQGDYFEAHEVLETVWRQDQTPGRELYQGILQVGIAYLQIERGNYIGALKMFQRARRWLDPLPDQCRGVQVGLLRQDAQRAQAALKALGRERIAEFDRALFRPVIFQNPS